MKHCKRCLAPLEDGEVCGECVRYADSEAEMRKGLADEWADFWRENTGKTVLYAYSGGKDSTAALFCLLRDARRYGVRVDVFTVETGFKGRRTAENIDRCIGYFGLQDSFTKIDISDRPFSGGPIDEMFGRPVSVSEAYVSLFEKKIIPCGKVCNYFLDTVYAGLSERRGVPYILTGGDTPKYNGERFSLYWRKKSGVTIVRTGAAYGLTKRAAGRIISENAIPWRDPECGGYDTDCLVPGAVFRAKYAKIPDIDESFVLNAEPIVFDYVTERVRHGVIDIDGGRNMLSHIDMASDGSYREMVELGRKLREREKPVYELNRCMNYITKGGETAVYVCYRLFMFKGVSQKYFLDTVRALEGGGRSGFDVPEGFIEYLEEKGIIVRAGGTI